MFLYARSITVLSFWMTKHKVSIILLISEIQPTILQQSIPHRNLEQHRLVPEVSTSYCQILTLHSEVTCFTWFLDKHSVLCCTNLMKFSPLWLHHGEVTFQAQSSSHLRMWFVGWNLIFYNIPVLPLTHPLSCGVSVCENGKLRVSLAECVRVGSPGKSV